MLNQFSRTELLIGKEGVEKLHNAKIAIFSLKLYTLFLYIVNNKKAQTN